MKNRSIWAVLLVVAGGYGCSQDENTASLEATDVPSADDRRPNILLVVIDDLGFTDIGAFGSEIPTPNLDRLAFEGVRLTNLHAAANCQGTRIMMMASTGMVRGEVAFPDDLPRPDGQRSTQLSRDWATIAELLQDSGYRTYMAGKWDLGAYDHSPFHRGFERAFAIVGSSSSYLGRNMLPATFEDDGEMFNPEEFPEGYYTTEVFTDKTLEYLQSSDGESPWFAYLSFNAVHWPLNLPDDWLDRHMGRYDAGYDVLREERVARATELGVIQDGLSLERFTPVAEPWADLSPEEQSRYARAQEVYAGVLEYVDTSVGRVVAYLEETDQLENTVIMVMSDHGGSAEGAGVTTGRLPSSANMRGLEPHEVDNRIENFGRSGSFIDHGIGFGEAASAPLRQFKATLNEGGLRAAALVRYPEAIQAGGVTHEFMTVMDILPTFLEVAGTEHPGAGEFQGRQINDIFGRSIWPHLTGLTDTVHPPTYTVGWVRGGGAAGAVIRGDYKVINDIELGPTQGLGMGSGPWRLYNLADDPGETVNLAAELPDLTAELVEEWETNWR